VIAGSSVNPEAGARGASAILAPAQRRDVRPNIWASLRLHLAQVEYQRYQLLLVAAWLDRGGAERDLMELNGWTSPQMLTRYGASARGARARRSYDRIMDDT
jgi:hypothetical protein